MDHKLKTSSNMRSRKITTISGKNSWKERTQQVYDELEITEPITGGRETVKQKIKAKTLQYFKKKINKEDSNVEVMSKTKFLLDGIHDWTPGKRPEYMNKLNRLDVSTIFIARTRMIDAKNNFRGKYRDLICTAVEHAKKMMKHSNIYLKNVMYFIQKI